MDEYIGFLKSSPVYEIIIFGMGMLAGYVIYEWRRQKKKKERDERRIKAHA